MTNYSSNNTSRAFTLVEMIVSLAVFSIVAVVALGALTKIVSANRKAQTLQTSMTNLNFALETMSRELRVSPYYYCDSSDFYSDTSLTVTTECPSSIVDASGAIVVFRSTKIPPSPGNTCNLLYAYRFIDPENDGTYDLQKATQPDCTSPLGAFSSIIDPNLVINGYYLNVTYLEVGGNTVNKYPLATVRISGYAGVKEREKTYFDVQTSISPRVIN